MENINVYSLRSDASRDGLAKNPSPDAEGNVRLRNPGFNFYEYFAPTLDATQPHTICCLGSIRRFTPLECERLQGFPESWTLVDYRGQIAKDGPRNKSLGNSMAVPVILWIGQKIKQLEEGDDL